MRTGIFFVINDSGDVDVNLFKCRGYYYKLRGQFSRIFSMNIVQDDVSRSSSRRTLNSFIN